jgi:hypothetical protein
MGPVIGCHNNGCQKVERILEVVLPWLPLFITGGFDPCDAPHVLFLRAF